MSEPRGPRHPSHEEGWLRRRARTLSRRRAKRSPKLGKSSPRSRKKRSTRGEVASGGRPDAALLPRR